MKAYIKERTLQLAEHIVETKDTIRSTAKVFNLSKSTVHNDLSNRLQKVDAKIFEEVKKVLDINFSEKHLRGGESTKRKYEDKREKKL